MIPEPFFCLHGKLSLFVHNIMLILLYLLRFRVSYTSDCSEIIGCSSGVLNNHSPQYDAASPTVYDPAVAATGCASLQISQISFQRQQFGMPAMSQACWVCFLKMKNVYASAPPAQGWILQSRFASIVRESVLMMGSFYDPVLLSGQVLSSLCI